MKNRVLRPVALYALALSTTGCLIVDGGGGETESNGPSGRTVGTETGQQSETSGSESSGADDTGSTGPGDSDESPGFDDPAPSCGEPGECTCEGCPDSEIPNDDLLVGDATAWTFSGVVSGADGDGEFYIEGVDGQTFGGTIPTDESGSFSFTAPLFCGEQIVKCVWSNDEGQYVLVTRVITDDCIEPDIRVSLTWDELGDDFELHLVRPGGQINTQDDCTWTTCVGTSPDWGVEGDASDDPRKDVDNTGAYGPENISLANPEDGTYTVLVEHWGNGDAQAPGAVTFNVGGQTTVVEIESLAPRHVWTAGTIEWPSATVSTGTDLYDCTGEWASGCTAPLP